MPASVPGRRWRWRLTAHLQEGYCQGGAFYRLQSKLDNPDQRIAFGEPCQRETDCMN